MPMIPDPVLHQIAEAAHAALMTGCSGLNLRAWSIADLDRLIDFEIPGVSGVEAARSDAPTVLGFPITEIPDLKPGWITLRDRREHRWLFDVRPNLNAMERQVA